RDEALHRLAPQKDVGVIKKAMGQVRLKVEAARPSKKDRAKPPRFAPAGQSTQLIVGADGAPDSEIIDRSASLYGGYGLRRVYYSAFSPIPDSSSALPLSKPPLMREHRLYQADWLMRFYGFSAPEIGSATTDGMLDLAVDPKLAWALKNRDQFPVDVNIAAREMLLRVPGLGVKSVDKIVSVRRWRTLRLEDVGRMTRSLSSVRAFITTLDWTPGGLTDAADLRARLAPPAEQLSLF
ncbi:MAG: radical SAM protein, partial [Brevundimonas sp.]